MGNVLGTAIGQGDDMESLGKQLVQQAKTRINGKTPALAILMSSSHLDVEALVKTIHRELGGTPLIGCTTAGEFSEQEVLSQSAVLGLVAESDQYHIQVACATGLQANTFECIQSVADQFSSPAEDLPHRAALIFADGLSGRGEEAVTAAMAILGPDVSLAGAMAGDDLQLKKTFVFCGDQVLSDTAAVALFDSKKPIAISVKHGHTPMSKIMTVTKAVNNVLYEIDGEPALKVWKRLTAEEGKLIGIDSDQLDTPAKLLAFFAAFEMGLLIDDDKYKIRAALTANPDDSMNFTCTIYEGTKFRIMKTSNADQIASAEQAAKMARMQLGANAVGGALVFECAVRYMLLGKDFPQGVESIKKVLGENVPLMGFESYGEFCRRSGEISGLHNATTVVMLFPS